MLKFDTKLVILGEFAMNLKKGNKIIICDTGFSFDILIISYLALIFREKYKEFFMILLVDICISCLNNIVFQSVDVFYKISVHLLIFNLILAFIYNKVNIKILLKNGWELI